LVFLKLVDFQPAGPGSPSGVGALQADGLEDGRPGRCGMSWLKDWLVRGGDGCPVANAAGWELQLPATGKPSSSGWPARALKPAGCLRKLVSGMPRTCLQARRQGHPTRAPATALVCRAQQPWKTENRIDRGRSRTGRESLAHSRPRRAGSPIRVPKGYRLLLGERGPPADADERLRQHAPSSNRKGPCAGSPLTSRRLPGAGCWVSKMTALPQPAISLTLQVEAPPAGAAAERKARTGSDGA